MTVRELIERLEREYPDDFVLIDTVDVAVSAYSFRRDDCPRVTPCGLEKTREHNGVLIVCRRHDC